MQYWPVTAAQDLIDIQPADSLQSTPLHASETTLLAVAVCSCCCHKHSKQYWYSLIHLLQLAADTSWVKPVPGYHCATTLHIYMYVEVWGVAAGVCQLCCCCFVVVEDVYVLNVVR